jgi:hypothetical protein
MYQYRQKIIFDPGKKYEFPDFTIEFLGKKEREAPKDIYISPVVFQYRVEARDGQAQDLNWSSGTGLCFPLEFKANGLFFVFSPWEEVIFIDKTRHQDKWKIGGFLVAPNFGPDLTYVLTPVLKEDDLEEGLFLLNNPDEDVRGEINSLPTDPRIVGNPKPEEASQWVYLQLKTPLQYDSSNIYIIRKEDAKAGKIEEAILPVEVGSAAAFERYNFPVSF